MLRHTCSALLALFLASEGLGPSATFVRALKTSLPLLTEETFQEFVAQKPLCLIMFVAEYCGKCKRLVPEFNSAAEHILEGQPAANALALVDADDQKGLALRFNITEYPAIIQYELGDQEEYSGTPLLYATAPAFAAFVKLAGQVKNWPIEKSGDTEKQIEALAQQHNNTVLGVFREPVEESPMFEEFKVLALLLSLPGQSTDIHIAYHSIKPRKTSTEVSEMYVSKVPGIVVFKKYGFGDLEWEGERKDFSAVNYLRWLQKKMIISKDDLTKAFVPMPTSRQSR